MNHTFKTRSALVRSAEEGLRREKRRRENCAVFAICMFVLGSYLVIKFAALVLS